MFSMETWQNHSPNTSDKNTFEKVRVLLETSTAPDVLVAQISAIHNETHFNIFKLVEKLSKNQKILEERFTSSCPFSVTASLLIVIFLI